MSIINPVNPVKAAKGSNGSGTNGFSPIIETVPIGNGTRLVITTADGTKTVDIFNGTPPTIAVTVITGGHRVTVTDVNGTQTFDVMDGTGGVGDASLPTIKDTAIDNLSVFTTITSDPIFASCFRLVNCILGYTFDDDIVYIRCDGDKLYLATIDNATAEFSVAEDGTIILLRNVRLGDRVDELEKTIDELKENNTGGSTLYNFGHGLKTLQQDGKTYVEVNSVNDFDGDKTLPMTAAGVETIVGNIDALLGTI